MVVTGEDGKRSMEVGGCEERLVIVVVKIKVATKIPTEVGIPYSLLIIAVECERFVNGEAIWVGGRLEGGLTEDWRYKR